MNENDTTRDFHDELLSAYLDGELSPGERARVDERLAVDPDARHVLDELRSVSQAVQSLPQESLGEDLRASILERAQRALPAALSENGDVPSGADAAFPRLTIGRTARGWTWAALAVAAALMIMVLQPGEGPDNKPRDVAAVDANGGEDANRGMAIGGGELRAAGERAELELAVGNAAGQRASERLEANQSDRLATSAQLGGLDARPNATLGNNRTAGRAGQVGQGLARDEVAAFDASAPVLAGAAEPVSASGRTLQPADEAQLATAAEEPVVLSRPLVRGGETGEAEKGAPTLALGDADMGLNVPRGMLDGRAGVARGRAILGAEVATPPDDLLLVYVNVKREALENRTFDRQLESNGIVLESPPIRPVEDLAADDSERDAYDYYGLNANEALLRLKQSEPGAIDAIFVDAPATQIVALIGALNADTDNVVDVKLDDGRLADKSAELSELAVLDWSKLERVSVSDELRRRWSEGLAEQQRASVGVSELAETSGRGRGGRDGGGRGARGGRGAGGRRGGRSGRGAMPGQGQSSADQPAGQPGVGRGESSGSEPTSGESVSASGFGAAGFGGGGMGGRRMTEVARVEPPVGRASRVVFAPPPAQPTSQVEQRSARDGGEMGNAQSGAGRTDAARTPATPTQELARADDLATERDAEPQRQMAENRGRLRNAETEAMGLQFRGRVERQAQRGPSLQVLFVLRAAPDLAAPAAARPATPPTSLPAGDRAK